MSLPTPDTDIARELLKDYLESLEELADLPFLVAQPKQIGPMIDEALEKNLGMCCSIQPVKVGYSRKDLPYLIFDQCNFVLRFYENPEMKSQTYDGFTAAYFCALKLHGHNLDDSRDMVVLCDPDTVTPGDDMGDEEKPCISWDLPVTIRITPRVTKRQVATPSVIVGEDGRVQMSCSTPGAQIFFTRNGKTPNSGSEVYTGILEDVTNPGLIKAKAYLISWIASPVATAVAGQIQEAVVTIAQMNAALAQVNSPTRWDAATGKLLIKATDNLFYPIAVTVSEQGDTSVVTEDEPVEVP